MYLFSRVFFLFLFQFVVLQARAITPESMLWSAKKQTPAIFSPLTFNPTYRIGDEWGKKVVTQEDLDSDEHFRRMALATAKVGGGTGFFLGEFDGHLVMATNHHVCPTAQNCMGRRVNFPLLQLQAPIVDFYGSWPNIDLALFEIQVDDPGFLEALVSVASPFDFDADLYRGQSLVTIGFGSGSNPWRQLVANRDSDCIVFSGDGEYRLMADPDDLNPGPYLAWSFANGCDVSHGDSGSAMMDRVTGAVIGIIWTGRIPKDSSVQNSNFLRNLLANPSEVIWEELSYGVPSVHMKAFLIEQIVDQQIRQDHAFIIQSMF